MSAVVLRCPNCGTTQGGPGLCEACHEADVRYFCPNHTPGRWLDGPKCDACGAELGREPATPPRRPPPPRPRPTPTLGPSSAPPRRAPGATGGAARRRREEPPPPLPFDEPPRRRSPIGVGGEPPLPSALDEPSARIEDVLDEIRRRSARGPDVGPPRVPTARMPRTSIVGCFVRLVLTVVLLFVLGLVALYFFVGGGNVQRWVVDVGQSVGVVGGVPEQTQRGIDAYRAGDFATAERELDEAARVYRNSALALLYLARIRADAGDLERSGEYLAEAVRREPQSAIAHRELADYYVERAHQLRRGGAAANAAAIDESLRSAGDEYARALGINPVDRPTRSGYACVLAELGDSVAGERILEGMGSSVEEECR